MNKFSNFCTINLIFEKPAKAIRKRFYDKIINKLINKLPEIQWLNRKIEKIMKNYDAMMNCDLEKLIFISDL